MDNFERHVEPTKIIELIDIGILSVGINPDHHYDSCDDDEGMTVHVHTLVCTGCLQKGPI